MLPTKSISLVYLFILSLVVPFTHAGTFAITGAITDSTYGSAVQPRLEVRQLFRQRPDQWNLYLLALKQFQSNKQDYITSWYQIGGIHGAPNTPWDGVAINSTGVGYCCHSSNLFPCWHRPYIALFEQKLQQAAVFIAGQFPAGATREHYQLLAATIRTPYWDWAAEPPNGNPTLPLVVSQKYVTVQGPTGSQTIINPLFRYNFSPVNSNQVSPYGSPWNTWGATLRYPTSATDQSAVSQNNIAQSTLDNNRVSQMQSLYNWFTLCPNYDQISNDQASGSSTSCHISLESLHNNIHVWLGGSNNGHMTIVPVSAWDPAFMLHHAMIDRIFAMWQALYPDSYITDEPSQINTATIAQGQIQGPNSALTPFHKDEVGTFWTCAASRKISTFHYTYPEFLTGGTANDIRNYVNNLYGPNADATAGSVPLSKRDLSSGLNGVASAAGSVISNITHATHATNGSTYQYIANIRSTRFKLGGSYTIYMFFGEPIADDATAWGTDANMVGSYGVFSSPGMTGSDLTTTSTVPLTAALTDKVKSSILDSLEQAVVVPYLQQNLQWRVATSDGTTVDVADVPDFKISVVSSTMQPPKTPTDFPTWSKFNTLVQITKNKQGGATSLADAVATLGGS